MPLFSEGLRNSGGVNYGMMIRKEFEVKQSLQRLKVEVIQVEEFCRF